MSRLQRALYPLPSLPLRLIVVLLAMVQFVAPTWHVCSMGGHVMTGNSGGGHHGGSSAVQAAPDGPMRPLICYCAPKHEAEPDGPKLSATPSHGDHATCLALLLQTMPGAVATPPALPQLAVPVQFSWQVTGEVPLPLPLLPRSRGRAPPVGC